MPKKTSSKKPVCKLTIVPCIKKEKCNEGDPRALKGVFDALTQYDVVPTSYPRCSAFAHSDCLTVDFCLQKVDRQHPTTRASCEDEGKLISWAETTLAEYDLLITNMNDIPTQVVNNFGSLNSRWMSALNDQSIPKRWNIEKAYSIQSYVDGCADSGNKNYYRHTGGYNVSMSFLGAIGPVHMSGCIPIYYKDKEIVKAIQDGEERTTFSDLHINWQRFEFNASDRW